MGLFIQHVSSSQCNYLVFCLSCLVLVSIYLLELEYEEDSPLYIYWCDKNGYNIPFEFFIVTRCVVQHLVILERSYRRLVFSYDSLLRYIILFWNFQYQCVHQEWISFSFRGYNLFFIKINCLVRPIFFHMMHIFVLPGDLFLKTHGY